MNRIVKCRNQQLTQNFITCTISEGDAVNGFESGYHICS